MPSDTDCLDPPVGLTLQQHRDLRRMRKESYEQAVERVKLEAAELLASQPHAKVAYWSETGRRLVLVGIAHRDGASAAVEFERRPDEPTVDLGLRLAAAMGFDLRTAPAPVRPPIDQLRKEKHRATRRTR